MAAKKKGPQTPEQRIADLEDEVQMVHREMAFRTKAFCEVIRELAEEQDGDSTELIEERIEAILEEAAEID